VDFRIIGQPRKDTMKLRPAMRKLTPYLANGCPKVCHGCGQAFPVRHGHAEAQVGQDGHLYCYAMTPQCAVAAVMPARMRSAA
jgi:hypothetical protein